MNKREIGQKLAKKVGIPKSRAEEILDTMLEMLSEALEKGNAVTLSGFGSFHLGKRKAGKGFNPHTQEQIQLSERKTIQFRPSGELKKRVNKEKNRN